MTRSAEPYELAFEKVIHRTKAAVLLRTDEGREVWLPLSMIREWSEPAPSDGVPGSCTIPEWLAYERGVI